MAPKSTAPKKSWSLFAPSSPSWSAIAVTISAITTLVFLQSLIVRPGKCISRFVPSLIPPSPPLPLALPTPRHPTSLSRVVFAIAAAAKHWPNRKHYIKRWYHMRPNRTHLPRALVWLDREVDGPWDPDAPPYRVSQDISAFPSFNPRKAAATRIARLVAETVRLGLRDVDWLVLGDDDTLFLPDNVVAVLSKYDPRGWFYIGSNSETHSQNLLFSFRMAFGGGGVAISAALAAELAQMQDGCLARYPDLYGSDERIFVCMSELGVPLTKELGFHQMDIRGNAMGMLAAHPQTPLVSIHHMDIIHPIFPGLTKYASIDHLLEAASVEPASILQQSMCYTYGQTWSFSISWGYVVQVYPGFVAPKELETPLRTFSSVKRGHERAEFAFNTREVSKEACKRPTMFYMKSVHAPSGSHQGLLRSVYMRNEDLKVTRPSCDGGWKQVNTVRRIWVLKKPVANPWFQAPRRSCCQVNSWNNDSIELQLHNCQAGETLLSQATSNSASP